jgi:hypothetical protein
MTLAMVERGGGRRAVIVYAVVEEDATGGGGGCLVSFMRVAKYWYSARHFLL